MISIIICSRSKTINDTLLQNIKDSVGCDYELIVIDNSQNNYSIFEAYNLGIEKSIAEYLCFIHDDLLFHTDGWGNVINQIFKEYQEIGLIGVAGAKYKSKMPSAWWFCPKEDKVANIIQSSPKGIIEKWVEGFDTNSRAEVVVIDGVFMALRKDNRIRFSTKMMGYHNYDLNISFEYKKHGYAIVVTKEILIEHFSEGSINGEWVESAYRMYRIYRNNLSLNIEISKRNKKLEIINAIRFIDEGLKFKKYKEASAIWLKLFYKNPIMKYHFVFLKTILKRFYFDFIKNRIKLLLRLY